MISIYIHSLVKKISIKRFLFHDEFIQKLKHIYFIDKIMATQDMMKRDEFLVRKFDGGRNQNSQGSGNMRILEGARGRPSLNMLPSIFSIKKNPLSDKGHSNNK